MRRIIVKRAEITKPMEIARKQKHISILQGDQEVYRIYAGRQGNSGKTVISHPESGNRWVWNIPYETRGIEIARKILMTGGTL